MTADIITAFITAMEMDGIRPVDPIAARLETGRIIRFRAEGDRPGRKSGWALLHLDGVAAGAYGHYRLGISRNWRLGTADRPISAPERRERAAAWCAAKLKRDEAQRNSWERAAIDAEHLWQSCEEADGRHRYLVRKGVSPDGLRQLSNRVHVPMFDGTGRVWNIQRISPDGEKRFLKCARTTGLWWPRGTLDSVLCIGEGVATMAAVHRATGYAVAAAFSAHNLEPAARALRALHPDVDIILCADDDAHLPNNIGLQHARAAALAVAGRVAVPPRGYKP